MRIDDAIFHEIQSFDMADDFFSSRSLSRVGVGDERVALLDELKAREAGYESYAGVPDGKRDEVDEADILFVKRFDRDGLLAEGLREWYGGEGKMLEGIRSAYCPDTSDGRLAGDDRRYVYYVSGMGYDTISADLLGGKADGVARRQFLAMLNQPESVPAENDAASSLAMTPADPLSMAMDADPVPGMAR